MNQIQEAIARVIGLDEVMESNQQLSVAVEHLGSENALLQRQVEDLDYLNIFDMGSVVEVINSRDRKATLMRLRRLRHENPLAKQSVQLIKRFTLGKGVELVIGLDPKKDPEIQSPSEVGPKVNGLFPGNRPGKPTDPPLVGNRPRPQVSEAEADDPLKQIVMSFWKDPDNQLALTSRSAMQEWLDGIITDGERFFICFQDSSDPYVKLTDIPLEEVDSIIYDPDNHLKPVYYRRVYQEMSYDGTSEQYIPKGTGPTTKYYLDYRILEEELGDLAARLRIPKRKLAPPEQRIFHTMANPVWTKRGKRGISDLFASREWFKVYKEFMEDRAAINAAATSVAYKRKIKGGPTEVAKFAGKLGGVDVGYDNPNNISEAKKLTRPAGGAIYDMNPAVDLEWMKTDTGAVNAEKDGRGLLAAAGAGAGIFIHYYGEGGDANLATAQAMELPMVKTFEDWQQWVEDQLRDLCFYVIRTATDLENAKEQIDRVAGNFPPIISQDVVKYMTAWSQLVQNVAPGNQVIAKEAIKGALNVMGVPNIDSLMGQVEVELQRREIERKQQLDRMFTAAPPEDDDEEDRPNPVQNGSGNGLPNDLQKIAAGRVPASRNGGKPAR